MELTLMIDGKKKTFTTGFISAMMYRKTLVMSKKLNKNTFDENDLDAIVDFIVELFGKQFTRDEFYHGLAANKLEQTVMDCINGIISGGNEALGIGDEENPN
ncbi:phage tail assembly chaperone G [Caenibacillus caldisaponilyticus]|uniref:phage tail assembly chaperone G n=1 Tax=Caenibacillus caldisaponilyticus TaxID=1674942 RepID=UPI00187565B7|nr:hypothetical protein [Caenibacillus caldisaponilyticus]